MSFTDLFKNSVVEGFTNADISLSKILVTLGITVVLALYIFAIYRLATKSVFSSKGFAISMAAISVITAAILIAMQSNLVISLGMVGALSIVRFRTAIKDPMDLLFLFWSIGVGIICGAGLYSVAIVGSLVVTVVLLVLSLTPVVRAPFLLVVNGEDEELEKAVLAAVEHHTRAYRVKSRNRSRGHMDLIVEVRVKEGGDLLREVAAIPSVEEASLLSHDGETTF